MLVEWGLPDLHHAGQGVGGWLKPPARDQRPPDAGHRCTSTASPCPCAPRLCVPVPIPLSPFTRTRQGRLWAALARLVPAQSRYNPDTTARPGRRQGGGGTGGNARLCWGCAGPKRRGWRKTGTRWRITQRYQRDDADMPSALVQDVPVFIGFPAPRRRPLDPSPPPPASTAGRRTRPAASPPCPVPLPWDARGTLDLRRQIILAVTLVTAFLDPLFPARA